MKDNRTNSYKRSFLIGILLGDAYARRRSKHKLSVEWTISHSEWSADLVKWKCNKLVRVFGIKKPTIHINLNSKDGKHKKHLFTFTADGRFRIVYQWFRKYRRKYITSKISFMDHPIGIAMMLCDDGSVRKRKKIHQDGSVYYLKPSLTIATHGFSHKEVKELLSHFSTVFGIQGSINPERRIRNGMIREYYRVHFNVENSRKLWKIVSLFIPHIPSMDAKFSYAYECFGR
jgi:hypothetical protein